VSWPAKRSSKQTSYGNNAKQHYTWSTEGDLNLLAQEVSDLLFPGHVLDCVNIEAHL